MTKRDFCPLQAALPPTQKLLEGPQRGGWLKRIWGAKIAIAVIIVVLILGTGVWGQMGGTISFIYSGNRYLSQDEAIRLGYVSGVIDAFLIISASEAVAVPSFGWLPPCTKNMNNVQIRAIVDKYMKDNPQIWHMPMASAVIGAMMRACGQEQTQ
jgi:hypothetical protein